MQSETIGAAIARLQSVASDVSDLRRTLDAEGLSVSDRQYLSRCFDLLEMELSALRQYLDGLA
jgi:RNA polymerase-interacting CarD/CdnL/TRCF family regulator